MIRIVDAILFGALVVATIIAVAALISGAILLFFP
jgi:hypothetical protein